MLYLDTSVLVSALTAESATARSQSWLKAQEGRRLCISPWVITEMHSALAMKLRLNIVTSYQRETALAEFNYLRKTQFRHFQIHQTDFDVAARFSAQHQLSLRAADALHLAIAADNGATLCTLDQRLFDAAKALGIACMMP